LKFFFDKKNFNLLSTNSFTGKKYTILFMKRRIPTLLLIITVLLSGCAQIYRAPSFSRYKVKTLAILPFESKISVKKLPKGVTIASIREQEVSNGNSMQTHAYTYFLRALSKDRYTVDFQDIDKTNTLLKEAGIEYTELWSISKEKMCKILGVDAVLSGKMTQEKPMSEGAAIAVGVIFGVWGSTNQVNTTVTIHEQSEGELLWRYDHVVSGSVGSSTANLSKSLMRNVSKKFPYKKS
jgi:hypothetical protein